MPAIEIYMDRVPLTQEQQRERGVLMSDGEFLCDEMWYLVDINVYVHPDVPVDRLAKVAAAISSQVCCSHVMEYAPSKIDGVSYNIFTLGLGFFAPKDVSDDFVKTQARDLAMEAIEDLEDAGPEDIIEYPYVYKDISIYLSVDEIPETEDTKELPAFRDLSIGEMERAEPQATTWLSSFYHS